MVCDSVDVVESFRPWDVFMQAQSLAVRRLCGQVSLWTVRVGGTTYLCPSVTLYLCDNATQSCPPAARCARPMAIEMEHSPTAAIEQLQHVVKKPPGGK